MIQEKGSPRQSQVSVQTLWPIYIHYQPTIAINLTTQSMGRRPVLVVHVPSVRECSPWPAVGLGRGNRRREVPMALSHNQEHWNTFVAVVVAGLSIAPACVAEAFVVVVAAVVGVAVVVAAVTVAVVAAAEQEVRSTSQFAVRCSVRHPV
jgi:hypothetical protein